MICNPLTDHATQQDNIWSKSNYKNFRSTVKNRLNLYLLKTSTFSTRLFAPSLDGYRFRFRFNNLFRYCRSTLDRNPFDLFQLSVVSDFQSIRNQLLKLIFFIDREVLNRANVIERMLTLCKLIEQPSIKC